MEKFQRHYTLKVQTISGNEVVITDPLTLDFAVKRDLLASANTGNFKIHNLGLPTRQKIYKDPFDLRVYKFVQVYAGYDQQSLIFRGNITSAMSCRAEGSTSVLTEIVGFDGGFAYSNAFSNFTLAAGTSRQSVISRLQTDLKSQGRIDIGPASTFDGVYQRGRTIMGPTAEILKTETNGNFNIDNEKSFCMKQNDCINGNILTIQSSTGLLGSPRKFEALIIVEILFEPRLVMNQIVQLISTVNPQYNGIYKVYGIEHTGTISGAVGGKCKTTVSLFNASGLKVIA